MQNRDVLDVFVLEQQIFKDAWPVDSFYEAVANHNFSYPFLALAGNEIAGYAQIVHVADEVHINNIAVVPAFRRMGIAGQMLRHIFEVFDDHRVAFLEVRKSNSAAIALYEKFNFNITHTRKSYYSDGEDALIMQRNSALQKK